MNGKGIQNEGFKQEKISVLGDEHFFSSLL